MTLLLYTKLYLSLFLDALLTSVSFYLTAIHSLSHSTAFVHPVSLHAFIYFPVGPDSSLPNKSPHISPFRTEHCHPTGPKSILLPSNTPTHADLSCSWFKSSDPQFKCCLYWAVFPWSPAAFSGPLACSHETASILSPGPFSMKSIDLLLCLLQKASRDCVCLSQRISPVPGA